MVRAALAALCGLALCAAPVLAAEARSGAAGRDQVSLAAPPVHPMRSGTADTLWLVVEVAPGLHVQAHPAAEEFLIPLELELEAPDAVHVGPVLYPPAELLRIEDTGETLYVCHGTLSIGVPVTLDTALPPCSIPLRGTLTWQACDAKRCFAPRHTDVELRIETLD